MKKPVSQVKLNFNRVDVRLDVVTGSHQHQSISRDGVWERHVGAFLGTLIRRDRAPVVFDVGANIGYYSVLAAKFGARVVAFEPNPGIREILLANVHRNHCASVTVDSRIVANADGGFRLIAPEGFEEGAFTVPASGDEAQATVSIDTYCAEAGTAPSIMKIDTEGRDLDVIRGALRTIERAQPAIVFEFQACMIEAVSQTKPDDLFPVLQRLGYAPYLFRGHSVLAVELVDFEILRRIYDLGVANGNGGYWDVVLWPPSLRPMVLPFDRSRLALAGEEPAATA